MVTVGGTAQLVLCGQSGTSVTQHYALTPLLQLERNTLGPFTSLLLAGRYRRPTRRLPAQTFREFLVHTKNLSDTNDRR
jgi:hypothetical protein